MLQTYLRGFMFFVILNNVFILQSLASQKNSSCYSDSKVSEGGIRAVLYMDITDTGGGGGGGTYIFLVIKHLFFHSFFSINNIDLYYQ